MSNLPGRSTAQPVSTGSLLSRLSHPHPEARGIRRQSPGPSGSSSYTSYHSFQPSSSSAQQGEGERIHTYPAVKRSPSPDHRPSKRSTSTSRSLLSHPLPKSPFSSGRAAYASSATATLRKQDNNDSGPSDSAKPHSPSKNMRGRGGFRGRGGSRLQHPQPLAKAKKKEAAKKKPVKILDGPLHDEAQVVAEFGLGVELKEQWRSNPKSPLSNHLGESPEYKIAEGNLLGTNYFRATVEVEGIIAVGDGTTRKQAEHVAALSAILQLSAKGLLNNKGQQAKALAAAGITPAAETVKLSDGSEITYERAREFMEYYCSRFKFGKPDIEYFEASVPIGKQQRGKTVSHWEAVMTVGGRRIGMGVGASKKVAQSKCYLDVTKYLESCDGELWADFLHTARNNPAALVGMAPHLRFQMSDNLNEDIYGLCQDIRHSTLLRNAPPPNASAEDMQLPGWGLNRVSRLSPQQAEAKSKALQDRLDAYQSDPKLERMRAQRDSLPVKTKANDILAKIEVNDVTVIMAATGSGKTTQIPQLLFDDYINRGEGANCNILCTQPRRLAAMSVAERIADERGQTLGNEVGYQVRFDSKPPQPNGSITFCTTGVFLKRMQSSLGANAHPSTVAAMDQITHIVVDEVHERDIDTDLSLVVLKRLLADRKARGVPLKVVLMSATINPTLFQEYFADVLGRPAPIAEVPGRTFPVQKHWLDEIVPQLRSERGTSSVFSDKAVAEYLNNELSHDRALFGPNTGMELAIPYPLVALTIAHVMRQSDDGHVLVFLPGWDEIKKVADILLDRRQDLLGVRFDDESKYSIHYLHSTIPAAEQREVFKPPPTGVRRIILATNIAETSVTIPDVVYVVDTGRVKEKRYDPDRHMSSLVSAWVGSSNLNQRAGRAGRHREGEYYGLVSQNRYHSLNSHQMVEMKRSDLSNVVMHVKALNLGEVEDVLAATIEPPEPSRVVSAMDSLRMLGAMDANKNLTSLGRVLLQLPIEAAYGKLILFGSFFRCLDSALTLAAVLTNRDPFMAPIVLKQEANAVKDSWSPHAFRSDPLASVAAYSRWAELWENGQYHEGTQFCHDNFLSKTTLLQIRQVKKSLLQSLDQAGVIAVSAGGAVHGVRRRRDEIPPELNVNNNSLPLLAALIAMASAPNFAIRTSDKMCRTAQDKHVMIHNASVNARRRETDGPEAPSVSFNPAEKRLYAFGEKSRTVPLGAKASGGTTHLRNVTRLDPMTYMLFGAYQLVVTERGLECDSWLPVAGDIQALDDIQRLKTLLDQCMLRVFEGIGKAMTRGRDQRWAANRDSVKVSASGSSRITPAADNGDEDGADEGENESDDEDAATTARKRVVEPLSMEEVQELELLTGDVVRILDAYAAEREGGSRFTSRPPSRPLSPRSSGPFDSYGGGGASGYGNGGYGGGSGYDDRGYPPPSASYDRSARW